MSKQVWKGSALVAPVPPALVSCGTLEAPNVLTVAWTGMLQSQPPKTYISVRPERYSHGLITESREFVINLPTAALVRAIDYCGVRSGRDESKFEAMHLTALAASQVSCPLVGESPVNLECRVTDIVKLGGSHDMFIADIVAVNVDEELLDEKGRLRLAKAGLCTYAHGEYFALGKKNRRFRFFRQEKEEKAPVRQAEIRPSACAKAIPCPPEKKQKRAPVRLKSDTGARFICMLQPRGAVFPPPGKHRRN